jgi:putative DNA primase/helicase
MGWALEHLGSARCREIAETLIRVEKVYGSKLHGFCPVHGDQKSASAFYNFEKDSGGCQSCGEKWDLVKLWCLVNGLDAQDLKAFRDEFDDELAGAGGRSKSKKPASAKALAGKPSPPPPPPAPEVFVDETELQALPPLPEETINELRRKRGWSPQVIAALDLREYTDIKNKKRIAMPIRNDNGTLCNIRLYMPGAELYKLISWYDRKCPQCGGAWKVVKKAKTCKECGGSPNDYGRTRLYPPPSAWKPGVIWLCEGEPDTICALSQGLNAVTQTAGCGTWPEEFSAAMAGRDVVICYDADQAGHKGALKAAESLIQQAKSVRVITWPEMMGEIYENGNYLEPWQRRQNLPLESVGRIFWLPGDC